MNCGLAQLQLRNSFFIIWLIITDKYIHYGYIMIIYLNINCIYLFSWYFPHNNKRVNGTSFQSEDSFSCRWWIIRHSSGGVQVWFPSSLPVGSRCGGGWNVRLCWLVFLQVAPGQRYEWNLPAQEFSSRSIFTVPETNPAHKHHVQCLLKTQTHLMRVLTSLAGCLCFVDESWNSFP